MFNPVPEPVSGTRPGPSPGPGFLSGMHGGEVRASRAAHAAAGAARPFPAPVGMGPCIFMCMHMHVYARGWTSVVTVARAVIRVRRVWCAGGSAASAVRGRPPDRRALGRPWPLRCTIPINQRRSWCIASIATAILNNINPVFWDEDVLSDVFNRRRIFEMPLPKRIVARLSWRMLRGHLSGSLL